MIGCLHVGQLDNLGLQFEHTGWPERHWVEMEISQEVKNKNKNRRQRKPEKSALAGSSPQCRLGTQAPRAFPLPEQPEDNFGQPDQRHDAEVEDAHNKNHDQRILMCIHQSMTFLGLGINYETIVSNSRV